MLSVYGNIVLVKGKQSKIDSNTNANNNNDTLNNTHNKKWIEIMSSLSNSNNIHIKMNAKRISNTKTPKRYNHDYALLR